MDIPILLEPLNGGRFRAQAGPPWMLSAEGHSADEAARHLAVLIQNRLTNGARTAVLTIPDGTGAPPLPADDLYKTDWVFRELQDAIAEHRRQDEAAGA